MTEISVKYDSNDIVFRVVGHHYNISLNRYINYEVDKYVIRSISISCNSKKEWKTSYRAQEIFNEKIVDYGFNFTENDVGKTVFLSLEAAEEKAKEMEMSE